MSTAKRNSAPATASEAASRALRLPWSTPAVSRLPMRQTEKHHGHKKPKES